MERIRKIGVMTGLIIVICLFMAFPISCSRKVSGIVGAVVDGMGHPIPNVRVTALQQSPVRGYGQFETVSGSDGRFVFGACYPESEYSLLVHADGWGLREMKVRTGPAGTTVPRALTVVLRFLSADGYITDTKTGLQWAPGPDKTLTWHNAKKFVKALRVGGFEDWRMPTREELMHISTTDAEFPVTECCVWSAETKDGEQAWYVNVHRSLEEAAFMSNDSYAALAVRTPVLTKFPLGQEILKQGIEKR